MNLQKATTKYSVVIPVFNSSGIVAETIDRTVAFFEKQAWDYELILVNDASSDGSWQVLRNKALANPQIIAINLLRNYGQHIAVFCGFQKSTGDYVITLDDDLQNPPEEIIHLIEKAKQGHDAVFGRFHTKRHTGYRRLGSILIGAVNKRIFYKPKNLVLTNFRIIRRDVVNRICSYRTNYPYITGLTLIFSSNRANVWVEHKKRPKGRSNYTFFTIAKLVMLILFNYSAYPLHLVSMGGLVITAISLILGLAYLSRALFFGTTVPGWATVVVLLSFFNGVIIFILSMLGEYTARLLKQVSSTDTYHINEVIQRNV
ncbi:glycosyltransferase family 2 protein [Candidatus Omnitrophota bacterium]